MQRRSFLQHTVKIAALSLIGRRLFADGKQGENEIVEVSFDDKESSVLLENGKAMLFQYQKKKAPLIVWNQDGRIRAFSSSCTHRGCKLNVPSNGRIQCPCHKAEFNQNGVPVKGPAKEPLKEYRVERTESKLMIFLNQRPISEETGSQELQDISN